MHPEPRICVFGPNLLVSVTVEQTADGHDDIHFHAGGQGFWIARMTAKLGEVSTLCAPIGGETGEVARTLVASAEIPLIGVPVEATTAAYLHDRRAGHRSVVAHADQTRVGRHDQDELYGALLGHALCSDVVVVTGTVTEDRIPDHFYRRLAADLETAGVEAIADLHGNQLEAFLSGGPIAMLKVSDEDLVEDGLLTSSDEAAVVAAIDHLLDRGCRGAVVSRAHSDDLAHIDGAWYRVRCPRLSEVDHRGAGDSMTAALAVAMVRGLEARETLRLGRAAGAASVTRHGLGSSDVRLVGPLATMVEVELMEPSGLVRRA